MTQTQINYTQKTLLELMPQNVKHWSNRNDDFKPDMPIGSSKRIVWWACDSCGNEWSSKISTRLKGGAKCLKCEYINGPSVPMLDSDPGVVSRWSIKNATKPGENYVTSKHDAIWECPDCHHEWVEKIRTQYKFKNCPACTPRTNSGFERSVVKYITKTLGLNALVNTRTPNGDYEIDILVGNIGIELNGSVYHSEKNKRKDYHIEKRLSCLRQGIKLIQIWDDMWLRNTSGTKEALRSILTVVEPTILASDCNVGPIENKAARSFIAKHGVKLSASGECIGLFRDATLMAVMVTNSDSDNPRTRYIVNYVQRVELDNGFSSLLKHVIGEYRPKRIVILIDNDWDNSEALWGEGFTFVKEVQPECRYILNGRRESKNNLPPERFKNNKNLIYKDGLDSEALAILNRLPRCWNSGFSLWELHVKQKKRRGRPEQIRNVRVRTRPRYGRGQWR